MERHVCDFNWRQLSSYQVNFISLAVEFVQE